MKLLQLSRKQLQRYRSPLLLLACFQLSISGGVMYGWSAIRAVLESQKIETDADKLQTMGTSGIVLSTFAPLLLGIFFDRFGPRALCSLGLLLNSIGAAMIGSGTNSLLLPGFMLIAFGGPASQISTLHLGALFDKRQGLTISLMSASFQISFLVFPLFKFLALPLSQMFTIYALVLFVTCVVSFIFWPDSPVSVDAGPAASASESTSEESSKAENVNCSKIILTRPVSTPAHKTTCSLYPSFMNQFWSFSFLSLLLYAPLTIFLLNHITIDVNQHIDEIVNPADVDYYSDWFSLLLPAGFISVPLFGYFSDHFGMAMASFAQHSMVTLYAILLVFSAWNSSLIIWAWVTYTIGRACSFSFVFQILGYDYSPHYYGRLQGILFLLTSLVFSVHTPLVKIIGSHRRFSVFQLGLLIPLFGYSLYWYSRSRGPKNTSLTVTAELGKISTISEADEPAISETVLHDVSV